MAARGFLPFPISRPAMLVAQKRSFTYCIVVHEGLPLLGAEDHRMDVAAWLQDLGLERYLPAFRDID